MKKLKKALAYFILAFTRNLNFQFLNHFRVKLYRTLGTKIGKNVKIKSGVIIEYPKNLIIGNSVSIQHNCYISAFSGVEIGDNVSIAHDVSILSSTHEYQNQIIIKDAPLIKLPVSILDNVWIGMKSSIVGAKISSGSVIAAHSFVNRDTLNNEVVGGCPIKHIKYREA